MVTPICVILWKTQKKERELMNTVERRKIWSVVIFTYVLCYGFRIFEYFVLRTDQTWVGEAIVHKLIGIVILIVVAKSVKFNASQIEFVKEKVFTNIIKGLLFGCAVFLIAYVTEIFIVISQGNFHSVQLYVSAYDVNRNIGYQIELLFFVICIVGNIVNVVMEEGIFRGLFQKLLEQKYSFVVSAVIASILFGFWHMMGPIRNYADGAMSLNGMIAYMVMLGITSALVGFKFTLLSKMTGSLYMSMGDHFVNNTIVNLLHVVSDTGADELMFVRVSIAQAISFIFVLVCYMKKQKCA